MNQPNFPKAVFMDRDGVINEYVRADYIRVPDEVHLLPGAAEAIRKLNLRQILVIVLSNQQGVGKRIMTEDALDQVDGELRDQLEAAGAKLTRTYYCVHLESDNCECRKPKPGMILQAVQEYGIDLSRSVMIGDSLTDIASGKNADIAQTILLMSGATEIFQEASVETIFRPTFVARDLSAAVSALLGEESS